jgi:hypothetical protein
VTLTRLTDSVRCDILSQFRSTATAPAISTLEAFFLLVRQHRAAAASDPNLPAAPAELSAPVFGSATYTA